MISPIKTVFENLSDKQIILRVGKHASVILGAKGGAYSVVEAAGDVFSQAESDAYSAYILGLVRAGLIKISYTVDKVFDCAKSTGYNLNAPYTNGLRDWYMTVLGLNKPIQKEAPKKQEPVKDVKPAEEPAKSVEEPAKPVEEQKQEEPLKIEEPSQEPVQTEEKTTPPAADVKPVEEPAKPAPRAGRKIKVK